MPERILTSSENAKMGEVRRLNFLSRNFRPMGPGSIRGSVLTLISGCAGVGMLGLPKVMGYFGLLLGSLLFMFCGFMSSTSLICVSEAMQISGKRRYANLVGYFIGKKWGKIFSKVLCVVYIAIVVLYVVA